MLLDGWSLSTLIAEVFASYEALRHGEEPRLGRPRPYRDYIAWLEAQDLARAEVYWRERLAGFRAATPLRLEPPRGTATGALEEWSRLPAALTASLEGLARRHRLTLNTVLQGVWAILLSRYSGEMDVVFGTTVSGRPEGLEGVDSIVGLFVNTLPVRAEVRGPARLGSWLNDLQQEQVLMRELESTPLARIMGWSDLPRGTALFHTLFGFENYPASAAFESQADRGDLTLDDIRTSERVDLPVSFGVMPGGEGLSLYLGFDSRRLERAAALRMLGHFTALLGAVASGLDQPIGGLPILTRIEAAQLLLEWNDTGAPGPGDRCLHTLFETQTLWTPHAPAAISGEIAYSYEDLNARANQLAHHLRELGAGPEETVGICLERDLPLLVAILGVLKSGSAYVPIDPDYPQDRVSFMLRDARVSRVLTVRHLLDRLRDIEAPLLLLDEDWPTIARQSLRNPAPLARPESLAYAIYTSGSTGQPKAALIEHRSLVAYTVDIAERFGLESSDRFLQFAAAGFDVLAEELFPVWWSGAAVVMPTQRQVPTPMELTRMIEEQKVTAFELPTGYWQEWIYDLTIRNQPVPASVRLAIVGGQRVSPERLADWRRSGLALLNVYGLTEVTITSTVYRLEPGDPEITEGFELPIGRPTAGTRLYLLGSDYLPVPLGSPGELFIGGPGVARGYLHRPGLTAERFVPDPFAPGGGRLYRTGDLVRCRPDGNLEFLGRIDNQVKVRGYRVEPGEIEALLSRCPGVQEAVVLAHQDKEGESFLAAYALVGTGPTSPGVAEIRDFLRQRLPAYMVPAAIIPMTELPRTTHGKTDRRALPRPGEILATRGEALGTPRDLMEFELVRIWEEVLAVRPVGITSDFFELGGQSLSAMRLIAKIKKRFDLDLPIIALFQAPTVEKLAAVLRREIRGLPYTPLVEIQRGGAKPRLFCVHPAGGGVLSYRELASLLGADRPFYGFQAPGQSEGQEPLDSIEALATLYVKAMRELQPAGPYLLAGWSFGSYVAFEMAQQLLAAGEDVPLLVVMDTSAHTDAQGRDPLKVSDARLLYRTLELDLSDETLAHLDPDGQLAYVIDLARERNLLPPDSDVAQARRQIKLYKAHALAERSYRSRSYPGRVLLLRAAEQPEATAQSPDLGWREILSGDFDVFEVPGNHMEMLQPPHVKGLAQTLGSFLTTLGL